MRVSNEQRKRTGVRILLGVLVVGMLVSCNQEHMIQEEVDLGYRGEARVNPFLAAERFLNQRGIEAQRQFSLSELPDENVVMILPKSAVRTESEAWRLLEWVEMGGHLIYISKDSHLIANWNQAPKEDEDERDEEGDDEDEVSEDPILSWFDISESTRKKGTRSIQIQGQSLEVKIPKGPGYDVPRDWVRQDGALRGGSAKDGFSFASFPYEDGRLTLLADSWPWENRYVGDGDHAEFLWTVITLTPNVKGVRWLRSTQASFWTLLWKHGWMPLLSLLVFVIFWLWRGIPRFGPMLPAPEDAPRQFGTHLMMSGGFLWKHGSIGPLLDPLRRKILRQYQKNSMLAGAVDPEQTFAALAELSGLSLDRVRWAMETKTIKRPDRFVEILRDLQKIELNQ